jgi:DNA-binding IclR family transcriptional regulator
VDAADKVLFVLKFVRERGCVTGPMLTGQPGWNRAQTCRYLKHLSERGWLERVNDSGHPRYVLGREALALGFPGEVRI